MSKLKRRGKPTEEADTQLAEAKSKLRQLKRGRSAATATLAGLVRRGVFPELAVLCKGVLPVFFNLPKRTLAEYEHVETITSGRHTVQRRMLGDDEVRSSDCCFQHVARLLPPPFGTS